MSQIQKANIFRKLQRFKQELHRLGDEVLEKASIEQCKLLLKKKADFEESNKIFTLI